MAPAAGIEDQLSELLLRCRRWEQELSDAAGTRTTVWYGIVDQIGKLIDALLETANALFLSEAGEAGAQVLAKIVTNKERGLEGLTLGQRVGLLRALDKRRLLDPSRTIMSKGDWEVLDRVLKVRNDCEHDRLHHDDDAVGTTLAFITEVEQLCRTPFVREACGVARRQLLRGSFGDDVGDEHFRTERASGVYEYPTTAPNLAVICNWCGAPAHREFEARRGEHSYSFCSERHRGLLFSEIPTGFSLACIDSKHEHCEMDACICRCHRTEVGRGAPSPS